MEGTYLLGWESKQQTVCHPVARWQKPDSDGSKRLSMRVKVLGGNLVHPSLARHQKTAWAQGNQRWRRTEVFLGIARSVELHDAQPLWSSATNPSCCRGKGHKLHCCTTVQLHNCTTVQLHKLPSSRHLPLGLFRRVQEFIISLRDNAGVGRSCRFVRKQASAES